MNTSSIITLRPKRFVAPRTSQRVTSKYNRAVKTVREFTYSDSLPTHVVNDTDLHTFSCIECGKSQRCTRALFAMHMDSHR